MDQQTWIKVVSKRSTLTYSLSIVSIKQFKELIPFPWRIITATVTTSRKSWFHSSHISFFNVLFIAFCLFPSFILQPTSNRQKMPCGFFFQKEKSLVATHHSNTLCWRLKCLWCYMTVNRNVLKEMVYLPKINSSFLQAAACAPPLCDIFHPECIKNSPPYFDILHCLPWIEGWVPLIFYLILFYF